MAIFKDIAVGGAINGFLRIMLPYQETFFCL